MVAAAGAGKGRAAPCESASDVAVVVAVAEGVVVVVLVGGVVERVPEAVLYGAVRSGSWGWRSFTSADGPEGAGQRQEKVGRILTCLNVPAINTSN